MNGKKKRAPGFTLIEVIVAIGISAIALITLTRLFSASLSSYNLQEQLTEMNQNARYTIRELGDVLMEAGANLQIVNLGTEDKDTIIRPDDDEAECSGFTIKVNPRGGLFQIPKDIDDPISKIYVDDANRFTHARMMQLIPALGSDDPPRFYTIVQVDTDNHFIEFDPGDTFKKNEAICSYVENHYYLNGTDLCIDNNNNVIAENIDSLSIVFLDRDGNPNGEWKAMRSVRLLVRAKTSKPDHRYTEYPDHCRRITLTYEFRLRNKVAL